MRRTSSRLLDYLALPQYIIKDPVGRWEVGEQTDPLFEMGKDAPTTFHLALLARSGIDMP